MAHFAQLESYIGGLQSDPQCTVPPWTVYGIIITQASLIPTCLLAAVIGLLGFRLLLRQPYKGHVAYSLSFLMFGVMMTDAMLVHCFVGDTSSALSRILGLVDVGLTSSVGLSFFFNGLVDLGLMSDTSLLAVLAMCGSYGALFCSWYYAFATAWKDAFLYLYFGVILFGCGSYLITQVIYLLQQRSVNGLGWLGVGGISGAVGVLAVLKFNSWFCANLGPMFSGDFIWFLMSDVAMYSLLKYFLLNRASSTTIEVQYTKLPPPPPPPHLTLKSV